MDVECSPQSWPAPSLCSKDKQEDDDTDFDDVSARLYNNMTQCAAVKVLISVNSHSVYKISV